MTTVLDGTNCGALSTVLSPQSPAPPDNIVADPPCGCPLSGLAERLRQPGVRHLFCPQLQIREQRFLPHLLPILEGTTVEFPNEDEVFHNVFSLSGPKEFDLPKYPAGSSRSVTFGKPGIVNVFCHIHSDMSAVILVLDNPFFTTPNREGSFSLEGVPPGDYTLVAWHERIKAVKRKIRVVAGQATSVTFNIPLPPQDR